MKKCISILLVLVMILGMTVTSFAAKSDMSTVEVVDLTTKKKQQVNSVNLLMGGKGIYTDVPAMIYSIGNNSRTLVPIRFVAEQLGAKVDWNQEEYKATIQTADKTIVLKVDSATATVNGKKYNLPDGVPAKLLGYNGVYRTMVPLRFVSEQLGMDVNWINETYTATIDLPKQSITGVEFTKGSTNSQILIKTTGAVNFTSMFLQGSKTGGKDRIVLDIPNTDLTALDTSLMDGKSSFKKEISMEGISAVRGSIFEVQPRSVTRVVVDLDKEKTYKINFDQATNNIKVEFENSFNNVKEVKVEKRNYIDAVLIHTDEEPTYNVIELGDRLVVDVLNAQLKTSKTDIEVGQNGIKRVRVAPFSPDNNYNADEKIVRVVFDLQEGYRAEDALVEKTNTDILVYVGAKPIEGFDYFQESYQQSKLQITQQEEERYDLDYDEDYRELRLKVRKSSIELPHNLFNIADGLVSFINIDGESDRRYYHITLQLFEGTTYTLESEEEEDDQITIKFENPNLKPPVNNQKIIVLDPGHGGKDPGAVSSILGLKEKNLSLDLTMRLKKLLEAAGYTIYVTRDTDTYVDLYERANLANGWEADAFMSIHFNAHPTTSISGVQVLYNPNDGMRDNKTFAKIVQDELLKELKAVDRGIVERPKLVVIRETKMPAVLAELAFITNPTEEKLVSTEEYKEKMAQALFNGIQMYFEKDLQN